MYPIPANATRIRYLESTGTQWINAGVTPDGNTAIESVWTIPSTSSGTLCGGRTSGSEGQFYVWARPEHTNPNQAWRFGYGTTGAYFGPASAYTTPMRVSFGPGYAKFGSAEATFSSQTFTGTRFYIFALCNGTSSSSDRTPLKLHWLKIWQSGVIVRDFVPVRIGQTGYLFDRVSGTLFGNAGTGAFVLGPDTFAQGVVPTRMMAMGVRKKKRQEIVDNTAAAEVATLKAKNAQLEATVGSMLGTYINPQTFAPSQAVFAQMQAAAAAKGGATPSGN